MQDLRSYATDKDFLRSIARNNYNIPVYIDLLLLPENSYQTLPLPMVNYAMN